MLLRTYTLIYATFQDAGQVGMMHLTLSILKHLNTPIQLVHKLVHKRFGMIINSLRIDNVLQMYSFQHFSQLQRYHTVFIGLMVP